jgi:hypothetical protein
VRKIIVPLLAIGAFALPATALAGDDPPVTPAPPEFAPAPAPQSVTDVPSANAFVKAYVARQAAEQLRTQRNRVRVLDVQSSCLQSPLLDTRFGCVFTLRAAVINRRGGWDYWRGHDRARSASVRGGDDRRGNRNRHRRFRVRVIGCLGGLTVNGGPTVTPTVQVRFLECARIAREDSEAVAPAED